MSKKSSNQEISSEIKVQTIDGYKQTEVGVIPEDWAIDVVPQPSIFSLLLKTQSLNLHKTAAQCGTDPDIHVMDQPQFRVTPLRRLYNRKNR